MENDKIVTIIPPDTSVILASWTGRIYIIMSTKKGGLRIEPVDKKNDESWVASKFMQFYTLS